MPRPIVVFDTNVVVSAHLKGDGFERFVLDLAVARKLSLFVSAEILDEYLGVLSRQKFHLDPKRVASSLRLIEQASRRVRPEHKLKAAKDPDDNKFLECAAEARADYLVTGNKRHFPKQWGQTRVVNARELLEAIIPDLKR
jgi:uncharacterized protein